jgi:hypothetical protein
MPLGRLAPRVSVCYCSSDCRSVLRSLSHRKLKTLLKLLRQKCAWRRTRDTFPRREKSVGIAAKGSLVQVVTRGPQLQLEPPRIGQGLAKSEDEEMGPLGPITVPQSFHRRQSWSPVAVCPNCFTADTHHIASSTSAAAGPFTNAPIDSRPTFLDIRIRQVQQGGTKVLPRYGSRLSDSEPGSRAINSWRQPQMSHASWMGTYV